MNATLTRIGMLLALASSAFATEKQVRVAASRELRVAVVDLNRASAARDAIHQAFAASLGASLSRQCGGPVGVRAEKVGADHAASNLHGGVYDAALVIGRDVPAALRRVDAITVSGSADGARRDRMLYLLIADGDASLQGLLARAFTRAMTDENFLECFAIAHDKLPAGEKIASAR